MSTLQERFNQMLDYFKHTTQTLAPLAGVTRQALDDIANGKTKNPRPAIFKAIADNLKPLNRDWLQYGEGEMLSAKVVADSVGNAPENLMDALSLSEEQKKDPKVQELVHELELTKAELKIREAEVNYYRKKLGL